MATTKHSVTLDEGLVEEALAFVDEGGLSRLLNEALRRQVLVERGRRLVAAFEAENGPIPQVELDYVDAQWPE